MEKLSTKKDINFLAFLFALTYMVSYITRINYGAIIIEMIADTSYSKDALSMALVGSFITYGAGQIVSGIIGDHISPKKMVTYGLCATVLMNLLIPVYVNPYWMLGVWSINGFAQSFMWPPLIRLMTTLLTAEDYKKTTAKVSWGSSVGTILVYLISPLLIKWFGWKSVFLFSAGIGFIMIFIWNKFSYEIGVQKREKSNITLSCDKKYKLFSPIMIAIMVCITLQGMLRDGVTTWMPDYIENTYHLGEEISILTGVVLPIFSILCFQVATRLYVKSVKNPVSCGAIFFFVGVVSSVGIYFTSGSAAWASVLFSALLTGSMHGVNLMLVCMIPQLFEKSGKVSTVSGVINSCTYVGSAAFTYGIALLSQISWNLTLLVWVGIAVVGTLICILCAEPFKKRFEI